MRDQASRAKSGSPLVQRPNRISRRPSEGRRWKCHHIRGRGRCNHSCPTGLVGLSATLFYGLRPGNCTSCSDAVQAYLQAPIGKETWVIIPFELWLPEWKNTYDPSTKLVVKLLKSLYGHPESRKRLQRHLEKQLKEIGGIESSAYPSTWMLARETAVT